HAALTGMCGLALVAVPETAFAQTDEIQVYDGGLTAPGVYNLTVHNNFTPSGVKIRAFPGAVAADKSLNGVPEWALGVTRWFEAGLYLPLYSRDSTLGWGLDGAKLRALFAVPNADDRTFFYGANFEFSYNAKRWDTTRITSEIRPIVGWHLKPVDIIVNPILDTSYDGIKNLDFAPSMRVAYNISSTWATAIEEYADFGPVRKFKQGGEQSHQVYGVVDYGGDVLNIEAGVGFGLTGSSDDVTLKLLVSHDLNKKK
ncbi:MAG TPA: hypothetical protein VGU64_14200, partial [Terriglobales bacterium]|nr:hypothetical protein [Terriglobales bacterium]